MTDFEHDDRRLVARMLRGDEAAFDTFVDEYYPRLFRFAFPRVGRDRETAQDVVQGSLEKVIPRLASYRGEAPLFSWLCTFCRFEIAAYWRRSKRQCPEVALLEESPEIRAAVDSLSMALEGPEAFAERRELARLVRATLDALPIHYGNVLEWKYIRELPVSEIATRLGLTTKAAESLLTRARRAFRDGFPAAAGGWTT